MSGNINLHSTRLQLEVEPVVKATLYHMALIAKPTTTMTSLAEYLLLLGLKNYREGLSELDEQRLIMRLEEWRKEVNE